MKKIIYILSLCLLLTTACSKDFIDELGGSGAAADEGTLKLTYSLSSTKSDSDAELLAKSKLKVYRADGELIRYYKPATEAPDELYLVAGTYSAELSIDADSYATTSFDECGYYGSKSFTITANKSNTVSITSSITNSAIKVVYDETISENFEEGYITYVTASDSFDMETAESDKLYTLSFAESDDGVGYFILPDGVSNISWGFTGTQVNLDTEEKALLSLSGVIKNPQAATVYTLNLKYSETAGGMIGGLSVSIDEDSEEFDDSFAFSPQPTITGSGFSISTTQVYSGDSFDFSVSAVNSLKSIDVEVLDDNNSVVATYSPYVSGAVVDLTEVGVSYQADDSKSGSLTLSAEFFEAYSIAGVKSVNIVAKDALSAKGEATPRFAIEGLVANPTLDLWANTGVFKTCITSVTPSSVKIAYRKSNATDWIETTASLVDDYTYQADIEPQWASGKSEGGATVYSLTAGFTAGNTYEYKCIVDGEDQGETLSFTTSGVQTIADSGFESSSLSCWTTSNSSSAGWASGNNTFASKLCTQNTSYSGMGGSACAYLAGASVDLVNLAAGNLFLGQFERPSLLSGQVSFGQGYTWTSRPTSLKFKYAASLGTVNAGYHGYYISSGSTDQARIFFAIVDWSSRHIVTSGTSSPSGVWDPATPTSVTEGAIIGYASLWITESTTGDMQEEELTVYYYDKQTKPSKDITIVISCATSAYGDYMNGSTSSKLYVDDFEFGY